MFEIWLCEGLAIGHLWNMILTWIPSSRRRLELIIVISFFVNLLHVVVVAVCRLRSQGIEGIVLRIFRRMDSWLDSILTWWESVLRELIYIQCYWSWSTFSRFINIERSGRVEFRCWWGTRMGIRNRLRSVPRNLFDQIIVAPRRLWEIVVALMAFDFRRVFFCLIFLLLLHNRRWFMWLLLLL